MSRSDGRCAYANERYLIKTPPDILGHYISKEDLEALKAYRAYRKRREEAGWKPRRFDDKKGIWKDLIGEWLSPVAGSNVG